MSWWEATRPRPRSRPTEAKHRKVVRRYHLASRPQATRPLSRATEADPRVPESPRVSSPPGQTRPGFRCELLENVKGTDLRGAPGEYAVIRFGGFPHPVTLRDALARCCGTQTDPAAFERSVELSARANWTQIQGNPRSPGDSVIPPGTSLTLYCHRRPVSRHEVKLTVAEPCDCLTRLIYIYLHWIKQAEAGSNDRSRPLHQQQAKFEEARRLQGVLSRLLRVSALLVVKATATAAGEGTAAIDQALGKALQEADEAAKRTGQQGVDWDCRKSGSEWPEPTMSLADMDHLAGLIRDAGTEAANEIRKIERSFAYLVGGLRRILAGLSPSQVLGKDLPIWMMPIAAAYGLLWTPLDVAAGVLEGTAGLLEDPISTATAFKEYVLNRFRDAARDLKLKESGLGDAELLNVFGLATRYVMADMLGLTAMMEGASRWDLREHRRLEGTEALERLLQGGATLSAIILTPLAMQKLKRFMEAKKLKACPERGTVAEPRGAGEGPGQATVPGERTGGIPEETRPGPRREPRPGDPPEPVDDAIRRHNEDRSAPLQKPSTVVKPVPPESLIRRDVTIDMRDAPPGSRKNAQGFPRDSGWFWKRLLKERPEFFSKENAKLINGGRAPIIDNQWLEHFPSHRIFSGDKLIHHHIDQGAIATPMPATAHGKVWHSDLHPNR
jgi:hypothetical protein